MKLRPVEKSGRNLGHRNVANLFMGDIAEYRRSDTATVYISKCAFENVELAFVGALQLFKEMNQV